MPQVKVNIAKSMEEACKNMLTQSIRDLIPSILGIDNKIGQVMLYESQHRAIHPNRDKNFVFIEVTLFIGRSYALKEQLAESIITEVHKYTNVDKSDIILVFYELTPANYFGGTSHTSENK